MLMMIVALIAFGSFLFEFGRLVWTRSQLDSGVYLSVRAGAVSYGDTLLNEMDIAYHEALEQAEEEIMEEVESLPIQPTQNEIETMIEERIQEIMKAKLPEIQANAQNECVSTSDRIAKDNSIDGTEIHCTDDAVRIKGIKRYVPQLASGVVFHPQELSQFHEEAIVITTN